MFCICSSTRSLSSWSSNRHICTARISMSRCIRSSSCSRSRSSRSSSKSASTSPSSSSSTRTCTHTCANLRTSTPQTTAHAMHIDFVLFELQGGRGGREGVSKQILKLRVGGGEGGQSGEEQQLKESGGEKGGFNEFDEGGGLN